MTQKKGGDFMLLSGGGSSVTQSVTDLLGVGIEYI